MEKTEILKIVLVSNIANEIENAYNDGKISREQFKEIFVSQADLMDTVPDALGSDFFESKLEELCNSNYLFMSQELLENIDESFDEKDIAFYLIDAENDLPEHFKGNNHLSVQEEHVLYNICDDCLNHFINKV